MLGGPGRHGIPRGALEELRLHLVRAAPGRQESALVLESLERLVPFHGLVHFGDRVHSEVAEALPEISFPPVHGREVVLHRTITLPLGDLWVAPESNFGPASSSLRSVIGARPLKRPVAAAEMFRACIDATQSSAGSHIGRSDATRGRDLPGRAVRGRCRRQWSPASGWWRVRTHDALGSDGPAGCACRVDWLCS